MKLVKKVINRFYLKLNHKIITKQRHFFPINNRSENDIYLVGFPKSGNTWLQNTMAALKFRFELIHVPDSVIQEVIPDIQGKKYYKRFYEPMIFKSHSMPKPHFRKVIYIYRDGRDVMVSYYHNNKNYDNSISISSTVNNYASIWVKHIERWFDNPYDSDIIYVKYEDMLLNPEKELKRICSFLNWDFSTSEIKNAVTNASFDNMQKREEKLPWDNTKWKPENKFIRRGISGAYHDEMSKAEIEMFNEIAHKTLSFLKYC